jgi:hypothetical protein
MAMTLGADYGIPPPSEIDDVDPSIVVARRELSIEADIAAIVGLGRHRVLVVDWSSSARFRFHHSDCTSLPLFNHLQRRSV